MHCSVVILVLALTAGSLSSAIPKKEEIPERIKEQHLSGHEHFNDDEHNVDYDHDAFLGEEEAKQFDALTPEESVRRLGLIVEKIDGDKDGQVTMDELHQWIELVQRRYLLSDTERQWNDIGPAETNKLTWEEYREKSYAGLDIDDSDTDSDDYKDAQRMEVRDERKFHKADKDNDGVLNKEEFTSFIHPEESADMKDVVVMETMEDIDKNNDSFISLEEYIGDMWSDKEGAEPDWVQREREAFQSKRDKDGDGKLSLAEVAEWILPSDYDHTRVEAKHLLRESDTNKDGVLSKQEILDKHDLFAGSQATDYGDELKRHEEL